MVKGNKPDSSGGSEECPEAVKEMIAISKRPSVPVISVCDEVMVGFDRDRLGQMLSCLKNQTPV